MFSKIPIASLLVVSALGALAQTATVAGVSPGDAKITSTKPIPITESAKPATVKKVRPHKAKVTVKSHTLTPP